MTALLQRLHARLGDFWWYSLMLFIAMRAADALNIFVGLWLVPKYVAPSELGAVQPLMNFANFLALPASVFASTFRQELSSLTINRQFGKMKTLMRSVFIATGVFFVIALFSAQFLFPIYLERIRIAEGSLGIIILSASFLSTISPVYSNALQTLKRFKTQSLINLLCAPVRFLTMIITMPLRAISGYFIGQTATPAFSIVASVISLRKELSVKPEPYWSHENVRKFSRIFLIFAICSAVGSFAGLVESTTIRQRLPEMDSAAYYIVTRFSDISSFLASTLTFTIFPFVAEIAAAKKKTVMLFTKASLAVILTNAALAGLFWLLGKTILGLIPHGVKFITYYWAIPLNIAIMTLWWIASLYTTAETAASRFGYMRWWIPMNGLYALSLLTFTGFGYLNGYIPESTYRFFCEHKIDTLQSMLLFLLGFNAIKVLCCIIAIWKQDSKSEQISFKRTS